MNKQMIKKTALASALAAGLLGASAAQAAGELNIYNRSDYMDQAVLDKFSAKYDIKVNYDTYDSNETLLAKLKSGVTGYDVAMPGDYVVKILIEEGLLENIEANKLSNYANVKKELIDVYYDPGHQYSVPYQAGTTAFVPFFTSGMCRYIGSRQYPLYPVLHVTWCSMLWCSS